MKSTKCGSRPEPLPTGCPLEQLEIERGLGVVVQRALRIHAEGGDHFVCDVAFLSHSMPLMVFGSA